MKHNVMLTITSLLSILLLSLHLTDDIVRGISKAEFSNFYAVFYLVIMLYGTAAAAPDGDRGTSSCSSPGSSRQACPSST